MRDVGRSDDPRVQAQLDRLGSLSIQREILGLDAIATLLDRLGNPHKSLPPAFHVAGTNGKGSTCAFLRSILEADGKVVHTTTSPHLVRYNERFRVAGKLIEDDRLATLLEEVFDAADGLGCSFFEITIAAAFTEFARVPADACVIEVGLGGRMDATNILQPDVLAACGIAALGLDHEKFLLAQEEGVPDEPMARIAFEKAGIAKPGVPLIHFGDEYPSGAQAALAAQIKKAGAIEICLRDEWYCDDDGYLFYGDRNGELDLPAPALAGAHQYLNAGLAVAMLRHQDTITVSDEAFVRGIRSTRWPARMQRLGEGPLTACAAQETVFLDGGHNPNAGEAIAEFFDEEIHLVLGMLDTKDPRAILGPLGAKVRSLTVVPVPGHPSHAADAFGPRSRSADDLKEALLALPDDDYPVLIAGSLYLSGEALKLNDEIPD